MSTYRFTIFEHPTKEPIAVKIGFCWPAFFFSLIWALTKRLWLQAALLTVILSALIGTEYWADITGRTNVLYALLAAQISFHGLIGYLAEDWVKSNLRNRGFERKASVKAKTRDQAFAFAAKLSPKSLTASGHESDSKLRSVLPFVTALFAIFAIVFIFVEEPGTERPVLSSTSKPQTQTANVRANNEKNFRPLLNLDARGLRVSADQALSGLRDQFKIETERTVVNGKDVERYIGESPNGRTRLILWTVGREVSSAGFVIAPQSGDVAESITLSYLQAMLLVSNVVPEWPKEEISNWFLPKLDADSADIEDSIEIAGKTIRYWYFSNPLYWTITVDASEQGAP